MDVDFIVSFSFYSILPEAATFVKRNFPQN